jgi:hypothetical protein
MRFYESGAAVENQHWCLRKSKSIARWLAVWHIYLEQFRWQLEHKQRTVNNSDGA